MPPNITVVSAVEGGDLWETGHCQQLFKASPRRRRTSASWAKRNFDLGDELEVHQLFQRGIMCRADIGNFYPAGFGVMASGMDLTGWRSRKLSTAWQVSDAGLEPPYQDLSLYAVENSRMDYGWQ